MSLLFDDDYKILNDSGLQFEEDIPNRFLIIRNYPLEEGLFTSGDKPLLELEVLVEIPANYNMSGGDMFWTNPSPLRTDGKQIPALMKIGEGDARFFKGKEYCRWSRHFTAESWAPKVDNVQKILGRIEWALKNAGNE